MITRVMLVLGLVCAVACEPEIGSPCEPTDFSEPRIRRQRGSNYITQNVGFDNCSQGLCLSVDGSRGYCTKECTSDLQCAEAGVGFVCTSVISFGELACTDWVAPEDCVEGGQCDCMRADSSLSPNQRRYCAAGPDVIDQRDRDYGREISPLE
jgi:hypothetical protein